MRPGEWGLAKVTWRASEERRKWERLWAKASSNGVEERERMNGEEATYFAGFVLGDFVLGVFLAFFALAVGAAGFRDVDLG